MRENMLTRPAPVMNTRGSRKQDRKDETTWDLLYQVVAGFSGTWWGRNDLAKACHKTNQRTPPYG